MCFFKRVEPMEGGELRRRRVGRDLMHRVQGVWARPEHAAVPG